MKSKKLLLITSSFLMVVTLSSCGGGKSENEELKAEFKTEKRYSIGDTISKDDIRVTYTKGNSIKELESKDFQVTEFNNEGKYTFNDLEAEPTNREKTFNVTYNKLKATTSTEVFNGRVTADEFNAAIDNIIVNSSTRDYTCDVHFSQKESDQDEGKIPTVEKKNVIKVKGNLIKADISRIKPADQAKHYVQYEDYNSDFAQYFIYDEDGKMENMGPRTKLQERYFEFMYFDYLKYLFDEKECFNKETKDYEFGFDIQDPISAIVMNLKINVGFDSNFRITHLNESVYEEVTSPTKMWVKLDINRTFTKYGETETINLPLGPKTIHPLVYTETENCYKHDPVECGTDGDALFSVKLDKDLKEDGVHKVYLFDGDKIIKPGDYTLLFCYSVGGSTIFPEAKENYFEFKGSDLADKKDLLFNAHFTGTLTVNNVGLRFVPEFAE